MKITKYLLLLLIIYIFSIVKSIEIHKNPTNKNENNNNNNEEINSSNSDKFKKIITGKNGLNDTLYWGTYKPQQYFGLKSRSTEPINTGLIWSTPNINNGFNRFNYRVNHHHDGVTSYHWSKHDGKNFGIQEIFDGRGNLNLTTSFIKKVGTKGGDWSIRISGRTNETTLNKQPITSLIYFIHDESIKRSPKQNSWLSVQNLNSNNKDDTVSNNNNQNIKGDLKIKGEHSEIGKYTLYFSDVSNDQDNQKKLKKYNFVENQSNDIDGWRYYGVSKHDSNNWDIVASLFDETTKQHLNKTVESWLQNRQRIIVPTLPNIVNKKSNIIAVQRVLTVPFDIEISFVLNDYHKKDLSDKEIEEIVKSILTGKNFDESLDKFEKQFDDKFNFKFNYEKLSKHPKYLHKVTRDSLSSLIGGIGYWYGSSQVEKNGKIIKSKPVPLYSATPSRTAFPRGFLWDEGFHQLLISSFDVDLTIESLSHWFNIMDSKGWIPREQILGAEAQSMVPSEFITQSPHIANPPTLILAVNKLLEIAESYKSKSTSDYEKIIEFLQDSYPRIQRLYQYYWKTQSSPIMANAFRWADRKVNHTLSSGLDDYPRTVVPTENEIHVDLNSWMAFYAQSLEKISKFLGYNDESAQYHQQYQDIYKIIESMHWDSNENLFQDFVLHPNGTKEFIKTYGYLNYFPFILSLLPDNSPKIPLLITTLKDVNGIWSRWGIRSLSLKDKHYGTNENYWRGPIWVNINYLFTHSMYKKYMKSSLCVADVYISLRFNLISNIGRQYLSTGFFWEQYDPIEGNGQRNHPFNGWTSLVSLIITEQY